MQAIQFSAKGISVCIDLSVGHIADLIIEHGAAVLRPLHRAPWIDEPAASLPAGTAPGLARLSGDFLCAPFSLNDIEPAPGHGWPANSPWEITASGAIAEGWQAELRLKRKVLGATVIKRLTVRDGHPFLYQEHEIVGGSGELPVAHHTMSRMADGGRLSFSPKRLAQTPATSLEPDPARGRYMLAYPAQTSALTEFPKRDGGTTDLTAYREGDRREDFVALVEADHGGPGWTALARRAERDMLLVLKNPTDLPITMLWFSNGGRDYAPWNGRHLGVLGIEDGRSAVGHAASAGDNSLKREGVPTTFTLGEDKTISFRQVIGALPLGNEEATVLSVKPVEAHLEIEFAGGLHHKLPFDTNFL
jgi:hypothetical protein